MKSLFMRCKLDETMKLALSRASALSAPLDVFMHTLHLHVDEGHFLTFVWAGKKLNLNLCLNMISQSFNIKEETGVKKKNLY